MIGRIEGVRQLTEFDEKKTEANKERQERMEEFLLNLHGANFCPLNFGRIILLKDFSELKQVKLEFIEVN